MRNSLIGIIIIIALTACTAVPMKGEENGRWERVFYSPLLIKDIVVTDSLIICATNKGIFYSTDGSKFNSSASNLPGSSDIISIAAADDVSEIYAVTELGYLVRSCDNAKTFSVIGEFPNFRVSSIAMNKKGRLFVGTSSGIVVTDRDLSKAEARRVRSYVMPWELLVLGLPIWRRAKLASDTELWQDWSVVLEGEVLRVEVNPEDDNHIIADIFECGAFQSFDEGESWKPIYSAEGDTVKGPAAFGKNGRIMVGLYLSTDSGMNFRKTGLQPDKEDMRQSRDNEFAVHDIAMNEEMIYVLQYRAAAVYASKTGDKWIRIGGPNDFFVKDKETSPTAIRVDGQGVLWAGSDGHGIFKFLSDRGVENIFQK